MLADYTGLATDAAACAIDAGRPARALELLEGGRAVMWKQLLRTRSDRTELHEVAPRLARRMDRIGSGAVLGQARRVRTTYVMCWTLPTRSQTAALPVPAGPWPCAQSRRVQLSPALAGAPRNTLGGDRIVQHGGVQRPPVFALQHTGGRHSPSHPCDRVRA
ncbi:hypothetical protein [Streptomyces formicae]|uniref:Uncharacterized protein n=1 Tax=Streptomyces formicae TaxID=1616117 RepID=A0ABY3WW70_9ACTN|nr:hypothetical protein [Streptomyces formicae]UNM16909.1 hypothetical protein J4032_09910 [Streptomyces formicae]